MEDLGKMVVPHHEEGKRTDIESSKTFRSPSEALNYFSECKRRLLDVNNWSHLSGAGSAAFYLTDEKGNLVDRKAAVEGDHFKIDVLGPGTGTGEGFDWVRVEKIESLADDNGDRESLVITVRPATNPQNDQVDVAHFFTDEATSSFMVERNGLVITAGVHGRNEKANTEAQAVVDVARNAVMALGAIAGFSTVQWKNLVNGILNKD